MNPYSKLLSWLIFFAINLSFCDNRNNVKELFDSMEIEDKCGQMTQITLDVIKKQVKDPDTEIPINYTTLVQYLREYRIGSILNTLSTASLDGETVALSKSTWQNIITLIHNATRNETKLKIPVIYGIDSIHGATYIKESVLFPQGLNRAATFNIDIAEKIGRITAIETRAVGIPWNFNPVLDMGRQPLWPRLYETHGEDTYLAKKMGEAFIKGHQGNNNLTDKENAAACLKHYVGYSFPFNGRDRTPALIPENLLRETFLPTFEYGVKAGALTVMVNSGEVNGMPGHANYHYLTEILKGELDFEGFTVSDWQDIIRLYSRDKLASTPKDAVKIAVMAGVDMSMVPYDSSFYEYCVDLAKHDDSFLQRVNDATMRILKVKDRLGLLDSNFDNIYPDPNDLNKIGTNESEEFNLNAARESIILAKNQNNILPLSKNSNKKILITGPTGNLRKVLNGGWSYTWQGDEESTYDFGRPKLTLYQAISKKTSNLVYKEGANFTSLTNLNEAINEARTSDFIILSIGEDGYAETPGNIDSILLPNAQYELANELFKLNKTIIVIYFGGRPRIITDIVRSANAVVLGFLPGNRGAEAVADILYNDYNPNGKLPITYPKVTNAFITYDYKPCEQFDLNNPNHQILFPFGHGLSYSKFHYSNLILDKKVLNGSSSDKNIKVSVNITNYSKYQGKETVILYLNDEIASVTRPMRQVKGFSKIDLIPNQTKTVEFVLNMDDDLSFINLSNKRIVEPGFFSIYINNLQARFELVF